MSEENNQGAWIITRVYSKTGVAIDVKAAGSSVIGAINNLYDGLKVGIEEHGWTTEQQGAPKPAVQPPVTSPAPTQAVVGNAPAPIDTSLNSLEVTRVVVTPKPGDKVELQLFGTGHKFPDLYHNGEIKQVLTALTGTGLQWTADMLKTANEFNVNFFADWRNSEKLNKNNKPYKNIQGYRAVDATA